MGEFRFKFKDSETAAEAMAACDRFADWETVRQYGCPSDHVTVTNLEKEEHLGEVISTLKAFGGELD